jgi:hypothetical protein
MAMQELTYIACDVPEGMRLAAWPATVKSPRRRRWLRKPRRRR